MINPIRLRNAFNTLNNTLHPVEAAIKAFLEQKHTREPSTNYSHAPSQVGTYCLRKLYYSYFKVSQDNPTDYATAKIFEMGNFVEEMLMSWLKGRQLSIDFVPAEPTAEPSKNQFPISVPELRVMRGYVDNLAIVNGKLMLQEIKSCSASKFDNLNAPIPDHLVQVSLYWLALNRDLASGKYDYIPALAKRRKLDGVTIIYLNKNTAEMKFFDVERATLSRTMSKTTKKLNEANSYIDDRRLPPKTVDRCHYCSFKNKCKTNWNLT